MPLNCGSRSLRARCSPPTARRTPGLRNLHLLVAHAGQLQRIVQRQHAPARPAPGRVPARAGARRGGPGCAWCRWRRGWCGAGGHGRLLRSGAAPGAQSCTGRADIDSCDAVP